MPLKASPQCMKKLDRAATVRERLRQSAGLPFPDSRGTDFCYFHKRILLSQTSKNCSDLHITGISSPNR